MALWIVLANVTVQRSWMTAIFAWAVLPAARLVFKIAPAHGEALRISTTVMLVMTIRPMTALPIVVVSGHVGSDQEKRLRAMGVNTILPKPFKLAALKDAVRALV